MNIYDFFYMVLSSYEHRDFAGHLMMRYHSFMFHSHLLENTVTESILD